MDPVQLSQPRWSSNVPHPQEKEKDLTIRVLLGFGFPAIGGLLFGYDIGATSAAVNQNQVLKDFHVESPGVIGTLTSASLYGAVIASILLYFFGDVVGRKRSMLSAAALYFVGSVLSSIPPLEPWGLWLLVSARVVYGLGIGAAMHSVPVYIAEVVPAAVRGLLIASKEAFVVAGMLGGYTVGAIFMPQAGGWRMMYGCGALISAVFGGGVLFLPDSPRWLLLRSLALPHRYPRQLAREALLWYRGEDRRAQVDDEVAHIVETLAGQEVGTWRELGRCRRALVAGVGVLLFQQLTCQPSVLYYAVSVFKSAGFGHASAALASVGIAAVKLVATLIAGLRVDQYGRRPLLLVGAAGIAVSLVVIGAAFYFGAEDQHHQGGRLQGSEGGNFHSSTWADVTVAGMIVLVTAYQVGFGPIGWLLISEVFPLRVRSMALSIGSVVNFGSNLIVTAAFPVLLANLGQATTFWMFSGVALLAFVFIFWLVPETKGKSLEEIELMMGVRKRDDPLSLRDPLLDCTRDGVGA